MSNSDDYYRIKRLPPYVFAEVNAVKMDARRAGADVIDLGMGNPDLAPAPHIVERLREAALDPKVHRYSTSRGIPGLRRALAGYYERRFGVDLDPEEEAIVTLGSKEGLANLAQAITAPGDVILCPNPSYPIHSFGFVIAGAAIRHVPLEPMDTLFDRFDAAARHSIPKPTALILNFPSNPTAKTVGLDFYEEAVKFARKHDLLILSDLAYAEIYYGDTPPPSILQVKGAKDVAVEFTSMSKTYSMAGWRIGFAAGNRKAIAALSRVKSYLDYGAFLPIQIAATVAFNGPQDCVAEARAIYKERRDVLIDGLKSIGWDVPAPEASMFAYAPLPEAWREAGSLAFSKALIEQAAVAVAPGIGFGEHGDGHVRIALVENKDRIRQAIRQMKRVLLY